MGANRIANSSREWAELFSMYNGGTYNNQFMILDKKKVNLENKTIDNDAFYIVEQLPGFMKINNVTDILKFGYWSSYNTPFDKEIIKKSKIEEMVKENPKYAKLIDYDICVRAKQFRRDQNKVDSIDDLKKLLRENNYMSDPFSEGDPSYSISSRYDLNGTYCDGAYDAKVGALSELIGGKINLHIIGGPTYEGEVEPFAWNKSEICKNEPHYGIVNSPNFEWFEYSNQF